MRLTKISLTKMMYKICHEKMTLKEMINKNETLESQEVRKHTFL